MLNFHRDRFVLLTDRCPGETAMDNNDLRRNVRRSISRIVHIATGNGPPVECRMSDVSETGARIAVAFPQSAPQEFLILLHLDLPRWCRVIWRSEHEIGIHFIDAPKSLTIPERVDLS